MTDLTVGSLCTGIAGLEHGLNLAGLNTDIVFVSDIDKGACAWLEANVSAPNLGDFTDLDELPQVDILTAGFPCQPLSLAGLRKGHIDERWLFDDICRLVGRMGTRPVLFLENVPGLLSANNGHAMARVVHGLAGIGYGITWGTMAAAAIGAPHGRLRWWAVAADTDGLAARRDGRAAFSSEEQGRRQPHEGDRPRHGGDAVVADTDMPRRQQHSRPEPTQTQLDPVKHSSNSVRFGDFDEAITRWEHVLGRTAPDSTVDGRLNPGFVEWMMGYPEGWVTDTLTNPRHALHALGNAVVPQCAAAAFTALANRVDDQAADGRSQTPAARSLTRW